MRLGRWEDVKTRWTRSECGRGVRTLVWWERWVCGGYSRVAVEWVGMRWCEDGFAWNAVFHIL